MKGSENLLQIVLIGQHYDPAGRAEIFDFSDLASGIVIVLYRIHDEDTDTIFRHRK